MDLSGPHAPYYLPWYYAQIGRASYQGRVSELFAKTCKILQQFKNRKTIYGNLPPKNIAELKPLYLVHVDLMGTYSKSIIQHHPGVSIIQNKYSLTCMTMIDPATGWFKIVKIPMFDFGEVTAVNYE